MRFERFEFSINQFKEKEPKPVDDFEKKIKEVEESVKEISPEEKEKISKVLEKVNENIPQSTLVGGVALRVWLDVKGEKVPEMYGKDFDFELPKEIFERVKLALPPEKHKEFPTPQPKKSFSSETTDKLRRIFRRKEKEQTQFGYFDFLKNPETHFALEDKESFSHLDFFIEKKGGQKEKIIYRGKELNLLSPEELFIRRINRLRKSGEEIQKRDIIYFYLNAKIINEEKMDRVVIREIAKKKGEEINPKVAREIWEKELEEIHKKIEKAIKKGKISEIVEH